MANILKQKTNKRPRAGSRKGAEETTIDESVQKKPRLNRQVADLCEILATKDREILKLRYRVAVLEDNIPPGPIDDVPDEILLTIASFLDHYDILRVERVSKRFGACMCSWLSELCFESNDHVSPRVLESISKYKGLKSLSFHRQSGILAEGSFSLAAFTNLERLDIRETVISSFAWLQAMTKLTSLSMGSTMAFVTPICLTFINPGLKRLTLAGLNLGGGASLDLRTLNHLTCLEELTIDQSVIINPDHWDLPSNLIPTLQSLSIKGHIDYQGIPLRISTITAMPQLHSLNMSQCRGLIYDKSTPVSRSLKTLTIRDHAHWLPEFFQLFLSKFPTITSLEFRRGCVTFPVQEYFKGLLHTPNVKALTWNRASYCREESLRDPLSLDFLVYVQLETLIATGCHRFTGEHVEEIARLQGPTLKTLKLEDLSIALKEKARRLLPCLSDGRFHPVSPGECVVTPIVIDT